jgi:hypothetical protein
MTGWIVGKKSPFFYFILSSSWSGLGSLAAASNWAVFVQKVEGAGAARKSGPLDKTGSEGQDEDEMSTAGREARFVAGRTHAR